jgi:hypothetical protein
MLYSLQRRLTRLAFLLGLLALLPLSGIVKAQPPPARPTFLPYFLPGSREPLPPGYPSAPFAAGNAKGATERGPLPPIFRLPASRSPDTSGGSTPTGFGGFGTGGGGF